MEHNLITREQKDLLLKDICARLPYGVKLQNIHNTESIVRLRSIDLDDYCYEIMFYTYEGKALTVCDRSKLFRFGKVLRYKPCLFPLSSMTEEQKNDLTKYLDANVFVKDEISFWSLFAANMMDKWEKVFEWCDKNHFDYRGLIPMGLAIDATGLNIY